jgi:hypothetical protein
MRKETRMDDSTEALLCDACRRIPISHLSLDVSERLVGWEEFLKSFIQVPAVAICAGRASSWRAGTGPRRFSRSQGGRPMADFSSLHGAAAGWTARARGNSLTRSRGSYRPSVSGRTEREPIAIRGPSNEAPEVGAVGVDAPERTHAAAFICRFREEDPVALGRELDHRAGQCRDRV